MPDVPCFDMARRLLLILVLVLSLGIAASAGADDGSRVDVVRVDGHLDGRAVRFVTEAIETSTAEVVILQIDSRAALHADIEGLITLVADPPVPLAVWVGPAPGVARGGAAAMLAAAPIRGAAPGVEIGPVIPLIAGGSGELDSAIAGLMPDLPDEVLLDEIVVGAEPIDGIADMVQPSIGQFVVGLHGEEMIVRGEVIVLDTAREEVIDGLETVVPAHPVRFIEPGLVDRVLGVGTQPATIFLFLVLGLALVAFEFYAAGPGVASVVAAVLLLLAGHGIVVLPVWWPAVIATFVAVVLYVAEFQRNDLGWKSILGTVLLMGAGLSFVASAPEIAPVWWVVLLIVMAAGAFFGVALTTVARSRFATQTIGREHLVGRHGVAQDAVGADGVVDVDGAVWKARATRAAGIAAGDRVVVTAVEGVVLHVAPVDEGDE